METTRDPPRRTLGTLRCHPRLAQGLSPPPQDPSCLSLYSSRVSLRNLRFPTPPPRAAPPSSARAARLCKPVVSLLLARIKLGTRIFLLDSVPWDLGSRVFCTTSRRYRVTLKQPGRREGGCGSPVRTAEPGPRRNSPLPGKALTLPERNERKTEKRVN